MSHEHPQDEYPEEHRLAPLWLVGLLALLAAFSIGTARAQAAYAASAITITSETQTYSYASEITFRMQASDSAGTISQAQLEITVPQIGIDRQIDVPVAQPGASIALTYRYNPSSDYFPPFSPITYHWTLGDNAQHSLTGADQHFDFVDTRFAWQHLTQGEISVYWYAQNTAYGQSILSTAAKEASSIEQDLNGTLTAPIRVVVYASSADLHGGLPSNTPNWAGGVALIQFDEALIVVGDAQYPLQRDLPHELTHLIFHEIAGLGCGGCPLWFDEGNAVYHQLYHEPEMQFVFDNAVKAKQLLPFSSIADSFPQDADQAELAYAQSWNFVKYLYSKYGQPKFARLVDSLQSTAFNDSFQQVFGLSVDQMEDQWRGTLGLPPINANAGATPSAGAPANGGQTASAPTSTDNGSGTLSIVGLALVLLLLAGLVGAFFILRRGRKTPLPANAYGGTGAPWPMPPPGYVPLPTPQGIATDNRYQWQIEQRQALLRSINDLIATERHLEIQRAELEQQIALYAAQERQERMRGSEDRALLALDQRRRLEAYILSLQQQLAQARSQRLLAMEQERRISTEIDAAFSQQAMPVGSHVGAGRGWPQAGGNRPPARRVSQE